MPPLHGWPITIVTYWSFPKITVCFFSEHEWSHKRARRIGTLLNSSGYGELRYSNAQTLLLVQYRCKICEICDSQAPKKINKKWSVKNNNCLHQRGSRVGYSFMIPIIYTQLFLVTISLLILTNNNQSRILSVKHGYRPSQIIFKPDF